MQISKLTFLTITIAWLVCGFSIGRNIFPKSSPEPAATVQAASQTVWRIPATVNKVVDGDTADVTLAVPNKSSVTVRVRIIGIDTPEKSDKEGWEKATEFARKWCEGRIGAVIYATESYDSFGRLLCDVEVSGQRWSQRALSAGVAKEYRK